MEIREVVEGLLFNENLSLRKSTEEVSNLDLNEAVSNNSTANFGLKQEAGKENNEKIVKIEEEKITVLKEEEIKEILKAVKGENDKEGSDISIIWCPNCNMPYEYGGESKEELPNHISSLEKLTHEHAKHYQLFRFRCRNCDSDFCLNCKQSPYHLCKLCPSKQMITKICRFCKTEEIKERTKNEENGDDDDVIDNDEQKPHICSDCLSLSEKLCTKNSDLKCILISQHTGQCARIDKNNEYDEFCTICWISELNSEPCVQLPCGHFFHRNCYEKRLRNSMPGKRLNYTNILCPVCLSFPGAHSFGDASLNVIYDALNTKYMDIERRCKKIIEDEGIKVPKNETIVQYGMRSFNFYSCYKCNCIYYGGKQECGDNDDNISDSDLLCGGCRNRCQIHDEENAIFKCKFCCSLATYFCFGHTHFCTPCHDRVWEFLGMGNNYHIMKENIEIKKCSGPGICPSGGNHPINNEEYIVGCYKCLELEEIKRNEEEAQKKKLQCKSKKGGYGVSLENMICIERYTNELRNKNINSIAHNVGVYDLGFSVQNNNNNQKKKHSGQVIHVKFDKNNFKKNKIRIKEAKPPIEEEHIIPVIDDHHHHDENKEEEETIGYVFFEKKKGNIIHLCEKSICEEIVDNRVRSVCKSAQSVCKSIEWSPRNYQQFDLLNSISLLPLSRKQICSLCIRKLSPSSLSILNAKINTHRSQSFTPKQTPQIMNVEENILPVDNEIVKHPSFMSIPQFLVFLLLSIVSILIIFIIYCLFQIN